MDPRHQDLIEQSRALAMLVLQSDLYHDDTEVREHVDAVLLLTDYKATSGVEPK